MTGPEHYLEAEQLLDVAQHEDWQTVIPRDADFEPSTFAQTCIAAAQAHATLALAAAMALQVTATRAPHETEAGADWREVLTPADRTEATS